MLGVFLFHFCYYYMMVHRLVILFLLLSAIFAATHIFAMSASLYWYYWWFDIPMHFSGGILVGLGVHAFSTFSRLRFRPNLTLMLLVLAVATGLWEVFEGWAGLHDPDFSVFVLDTTKDVILGFAGGLLAHALLVRYTMKSHE